MTTPDALSPGGHLPRCRGTAYLYVEAMRVLGPQHVDLTCCQTSSVHHMYKVRCTVQIADGCLARLYI
jgi:hypothetical protein